jgi:peptide/nickel transport system permease protein
MLIYVIRRILVVIPMAVFLSFLVYLGLELMPGDIVSRMISPDMASSMDPAKMAALRHSLGLDQPFIARWGSWFLGVLHGNFGYSLASGVPIEKIVFDRLPATLELMAMALVLSTVFGSILGTLSALRRGSATDTALTVIGMVGVSVPDFFFGLIAILVFSLTLHWLPVGGRMTPGVDSFADHFRHLLMPSLVLSIMMTAGVMRFVRSSMLDALSRDFVRTARSKGLPEWRINVYHALRVAMTPVVVLIGFRLPVLIGGQVIIERVFQWPGLGNEFISSVQGQDYPLVMMIALMSVVSVLLASLLIDLLTALIDPRVRLDG